VRGGYLKTCSVGFIIKQAVMRGTSEFKKLAAQLGLGEDCKRIITQWELIENSIVNLPSNQDALILAVSTKSINIDDALIKSLGIEIKEAPKVEEVNIEVQKVEEPPKVEEVKQEQQEQKQEPVKIWNVLRTGPYVATDDDKLVAKALKSGKVI